MRNTALGLSYFARDIVCASLCWYAASYIDPTFKSAQVVDKLGELAGNQLAGKVAAETARWAGWGV